MGLFTFRKKKEQRESMTLEDLLIQLGISTDNITAAEALEVPTVAGCIEIISNTIASIPIKLYQKDNDKVKEVKDNRVALLNKDTKDTVDAFQMKKALIRDYLLEGAGYIYLNKDRNAVKSLNYVDNRYVTINKNVDPIFKDYEILVAGKPYRPFEFLTLMRNTKDGCRGAGIVAENSKLLAIAYNSMIFENSLVKTGGNKKGFLQAVNKLTKEAIEELKKSFKNLYANNTENIVVLNDGITFKEASNTSVELQLNENKVTNATEICKIFNVPESVLAGKATDEECVFRHIRTAIPETSGHETGSIRTLCRLN